MDQQKNTAGRRKIVIGTHRGEDLEDVVSKTVQKTMENIEEGYEYEDEEFATQEEFEEKMRDDVRQIVEENPFLIAEKLVEQGIDIEFNIKKGGRFLCKIDDPEFNESKLQEYGEGTYTVALYKLTPKRVFVKQQTFRVATAPVSQHQEKKTNDTHIAELMLKQTNDQLKAMREEFAVKEKRLEDQRAEEKRRYEEEKKEMREREEKREEARRLESNSGKSSLLETLEVVTKLMPKQEDKSDKFMEMMMKMQENTQNLIAKMDEKNQQAIKDSNDRMEKLVEKLSSKKGDGVSERELREAIEKARKEGKEDYKEMMELVDTKAEERAEILAGREPEPKKEESMTDTLIKSALPMMIGMMGKRQQTAPMIAPPRRPVQRTLPPTRTAPVRTASKPAVKPTVQGRATTAPTQGKNPVKTPQNAPTTVISTANMPVMDLSSINLSQKAKAVILPSEEEKMAVGQLLIQIVGAGITEKAEAKYVSNLAFHALRKEKLLSTRVFDYYPKSDLIALKNELGLEVEDEWIETFYADFQEKFNTIG